MRSVNIAELKNRLSAYIQHVRAGEEIVIRDRNLPVAKLVPLSPGEASMEDLALIASGELRYSGEELDEAAFWEIGSRHPVSTRRARTLANAVSKDREQRDDGLLGR